MYPGRALQNFLYLQFEKVMPIHVNSNEYCRGAGKAGLSYEHWISHILGVNFHPASGHFLMATDLER